ncbi:hypothetical protein ACHAW5_003211 [Stephanodiscus triporus]|uniref:Cytochrome P450 n=1 Tax=Stephanodiscus triporus TaxID=2934178 RepID=A0ABD3QV79_9STRA
MINGSISAPVKGDWRDELLRYFGVDPTASWTTNVWVWTAIAFLFAALAYLSTAQRSDKERYPHPLPPRSTLGLFETLEHCNSIHFHEWSLDLARNQGKIVEYNFWPLIRARVIAVNDPKVARKILENPESSKPREFYDFFDGLLGGTGFISEEGDRYKHPRKSVSIGISHSNMDDMLTKMHAVMDQWITDNLGKNQGDVSNIDITVEMEKATIQSIGKIAFGYDFSTEEIERTLHNIFKIADEFGRACEKNPVRKSPIGVFLWAAKREASLCVQDIRRLVQNVLEAHQKKSVDEQKKVIVLNELNTPGSFALVELAKNKDVQTRLRQELRSASADPTDKKRLVDNSLLKRVIRETMRLWPVAAGGGARVIPQDMVVTSSDGLGGERLMTIPKGTIAMMNSYPIMRDKDTFDRPDEWLPNRWECPSQDMNTAFFPFMVGRRSCPGQLLAMSESEVFLARLVMDYEWSLVKETQPEYNITLMIMGTILQAMKVG